MGCCSSGPKSVDARGPAPSCETSCKQHDEETTSPPPYCEVGQATAIPPPEDPASASSAVAVVDIVDIGLCEEPTNGQPVATAGTERSSFEDRTSGWSSLTQEELILRRSRHGKSSGEDKASTGPPSETGEADDAPAAEEATSLENSDKLQ